jgi:hypothetical protein
VGLWEEVTVPREEEKLRLGKGAAPAENGPTPNGVMAGHTPPADMIKRWRTKNAG